MKLLLLAAFMFISVCIVAWQVTERPTQLERLSPLVGDWKMKVHSTAGEAGGDFTGVMTATWALDKTYVHLNAKLEGQSKLQGAGYVTFDDSATYPKRKYRAYLIWSYDGRCLPIQGEFHGSNLVMIGRSLSLETSNGGQFKVSTEFKNKDHIEVVVDARRDASKSDKFLRLAVISFEREN